MAVARKILDFMEQGSWIRKMFEEGIALKLQYGEDNVFDLSLGNPIMEPPPRFFEELRKIADSPEPAADPPQGSWTPRHSPFAPSESAAPKVHHDS